MSRFASFMRRNSVSVSLGIIMFAVMAILYIQSLATAQLQAQVQGQQQIIAQIKGITDQINASGKERTRQIDQLNRHLDCIVIFFSQKDRTQKAISDIDSCTLKNVSTGQVVSPRAATTPPVATSSPTPQTATPRANTALGNGTAKHDPIQADLNRIKNLLNQL